MKGIRTCPSLTAPRLLPVEQYDLTTGTAVAKYIGAVWAEHITGITAKNISSTIHGRRRHAGGWGWRWAT